MSVTLRKVKEFWQKQEKAEKKYKTHWFAELPSAPQLIINY